MPKSLRSRIQSFMDLFIPVEKSVISRSLASSFFAVSNDNTLLLGDCYPSDSVDEILPTQGKFVLIVARGDRSWDVTYSVQTLDDGTTRDDAQNKAISLVEENKNNVQFVIVCVGINKKFANRPMYQAFAQYNYISKEDLEAVEEENAGDLLLTKLSIDYMKEKCSVCGKLLIDCTCEKSDLEKSDLEKSENGEEQDLDDVFFEIQKGNFVNGLVYGIVYEPMKEDSHGHWMTAIEIEKMANEFLPTALRNGTWTDKNHNADETLYDVEIAQSYIAPNDFVFPGGNKVTKGSWVLVSKVNDEELKKEIEAGIITGYSLDGVGKEVKRELPKI
jgi:hypothetical protein